MNPSVAPASKTSSAGEPLNPGAWIETHGEYLYGYALRLVRKGEVAEDMVQESLLAAWRGRDQFAGLASERSWLTSILKRKIIDWLRKTVRDRKHLEDPGIDSSVDDLFGPLGKWRTKPRSWTSESPDAGLERSEFWRAVHQCADKLPPRLREVFVLWHLEETPSAEVCEAVGISSANLWTMLHRARMRLWKCLGENWFESPAPDPKAGGQK